MFDDELLNQAQQIIELYRRNGATISVAESCTGGLLSALFTSISGSSVVFDRGFVTYSNLAKHEMLGVSLENLNHYGAVSSQVASAMAAGAIKNSRANVAVSITGIAGPNGGTDDKPVGLVYFGFAKAGHLSRQFEHRFGDIGRDNIRMESVKIALSLFARGFQ